MSVLCLKIPFAYNAWQPQKIALLFLSIKSVMSQLLVLPMLFRHLLEPVSRNALCLPAQGNHRRSRLYPLIKSVKWMFNCSMSLPILKS